MILICVLPLSFPCWSVFIVWDKQIWCPGQLQCGTYFWTSTATWRHLQIPQKERHFSLVIFEKMLAIKKWSSWMLLTPATLSPSFQSSSFLLKATGIFNISWQCHYKCYLMPFSFVSLVTPFHSLSSILYFPYMLQLSSTAAYCACPFRVGLCFSLLIRMSLSVRLLFSSGLQFLLVISVPLILAYFK